MSGTKFVVKLNSGDFHLWATLQTDDDDRERRYWLQRSGLTCLDPISEAEYWDIAELCVSKGVTFMGYVK